MHFGTETADLTTMLATVWHMVREHTQQRYPGQRDDSSPGWQGSTRFYYATQNKVYLKFMNLSLIFYFDMFFIFHLFLTYLFLHMSKNTLPKTYPQLLSLRPQAVQHTPPLSLHVFSFSNFSNPLFRLVLPTSTVLAWLYAHDRTHSQLTRAMTM